MPGPRPPTPGPRPRGAPKGNLNALRTGASSKQLQALVDKLLSDPDVRRLLLAFAANRQLENGSLLQALSAHAARRRRRPARDQRRRYEWLPYLEEGDAPPWEA